MSLASDIIEIKRAKALTSCCNTTVSCPNVLAYPLSTVLSIGNTSGSNDIIMNSGQKISVETLDNVINVEGALERTLNFSTSPSATFNITLGSLAGVPTTVNLTGTVVCNTGALSTNATDGFLYVAACSGVPTGTPTTYTGRSPIVIDSSNNRLYFYSSGAWRNAGP